MYGPLLTITYLAVTALSMAGWTWLLSRGLAALF
jgi:hypothetical protein